MSAQSKPSRSASLAVQNPVFAIPGIRETLAGLMPEARAALRGVLVGIQSDAAARAAESWRKHKAPMACYWKAVSVYAGHIARALGTRDQVEAAARSEREELLATVEMLTATVELYTPNGAQSVPKWPRDANGDPDLEAVAKIGRDAIRKAQGKQ